MPLLSFVIPVYNTEQYIRQCLDSVINQNNGKIEVILVDDGSTDGSGQICDEYVQRYAGLVKVIHKDNQGLLLARRTGIAASTGEYIAHVDSDDYLLDGAVDTICAALEKNPCDMLFFDYIYGAGQGKPERYIKIRGDIQTTLIGNKEEMIRQFLFEGKFNTVWIKVTKRSKIDSVRDYTSFQHVANGEDVLQTLALIDNAESFLYIPKALYFYRRDNMSMSKSYGTKDYASFKTVHLEMLKYAEKWMLPQEQMNDLKSLFLGKNMVILHQVKQHESRQDYFDLMKTMSSDDYFWGLKDALKSTHTGKYYRIIFQLIKGKRYRLTDRLIRAVAKLKS